MKLPSCSFSLTVKAVFLTLTIIISGCATNYRATVDSLRNPEMTMNSGDSFRVVSSDPEMSQLRFLELKSVIDHSLELKGYSVAASEKADVIIEASLHLSDAIQAVRESMEPIYYVRQGYTRTIAHPVRNEEGNIVRYSYSEVYIPPHRSFAGYDNRVHTVTVFDKTLTLSAYKPDSAKAEIWNLTVNHRSTEKDLRKNLPYLMAAALPYIGERTDGEVAVSVEEKDPNLLKIKNVLGSPRSK